MTTPTDGPAPPALAAGDHARLGKQFFFVAWLFLLVTAILGLVLRVAFLLPLPAASYGNLLHAHSHAGFLGWVFNAFYALAWVWIFPPASKRRHLQIFLLLQCANVGMLASFPFQGYGPVSIAFSTLHTAATIPFGLALWSPPGSCPLTRAWLRAAVVCLFASGFGPLLLGPLAVLDLRDHPLYRAAIYWYLHFQYNGWFLLFPLALLPRLQEAPHSLLQALRRALPPMLLGVGLTYALSLLWLQPPLWVYFLSWSGAAFQLAALLTLSSPFWLLLRKQLARSHPFAASMLQVAFAALLAKALAQLVASLPLSFLFVSHRSAVIAFLHANFLLVVTPALLAAAFLLRWIPTTPLTRFFAFAFLAAALNTIAALTLPLLPGGTAFPPFLWSPPVLAAAAAAMVLSLAFLRPI